MDIKMEVDDNLIPTVDITLTQRLLEMDELAKDFNQAIRLLHVIRAWSFTALEESAAKADALYPRNCHDNRGSGDMRPLIEAVKELTNKHSYKAK